MPQEERRGHKIRIETVRTLRSNPDLSLLHERLTAAPQAATQDKDIESSGDEKPVLFIDDQVVPYARTEEGYRVYYQPPEKTLLEAARSFVDTQREASE